ncbi:hypothetical protein CsSME_00046748 [Camellia sinensis var. sinensis]
MAPVGGAFSLCFPLSLLSLSLSLSRSLSVSDRFLSTCLFY